MHRVLTGKAEEMRPLGIRGRRWKDNIKKEPGRCGLDSNGSGVGQVSGSCDHGNNASEPVK